MGSEGHRDTGTTDLLFQHLSRKDNNNIPLLATQKNILKEEFLADLTASAQKAFPIAGALLSSSLQQPGHDRAESALWQDEKLLIRQ